MKLLKKNSALTGCIICSFLMNAQEVVSTQVITYSKISGSLDFKLGEVLINNRMNVSNDSIQNKLSADLTSIQVKHLIPESCLVIFNQKN